MKLYLVRHGEAYPETVDPSRPLTDKGKSETQKIANCLKQTQINIDLIVHSGKKRAEQTAEILKNALNPKCEILAKDHLAPNDDIDPIYQEINQHNKDVMIVGHLPFLPKLASRLITNIEHPPVVHFKESAVAILEKQTDQTWQLVSLISPKLT